MKAELLSEKILACDLGEGVSWDDMLQKLYWVDITGKVIHRFDPVNGRHETCATPSTVGFAAMGHDGRLVAGLKDGIYRIDFGTGAAQCLVRPQYAHPDNRFNDGKCDRRGRLWAGTMNHVDHQMPSGALYRLDDLGLHVEATEIFISNGLGWSPDNKTMYYTDTRRQTIWKYDYDLDTGNATNRRDFVKFSGNNKPDGLCVDSEGRVITCLWGGWRAEIYTPDGKLVGKIELPVPQVTCCAFGRNDFRTLYFSTASIGLNPEELRLAPHAGKIFAVSMDVPGLPVTLFKG